MFGDPLPLTIITGDTPPIARVLEPASAVPDEFTRIESIAQDASAGLGLPTKRAIRPNATTWPSDALRVQAFGDGDGPVAGYELLENPPDYDGLGLIDFTQAALMLAIMVSGATDDAIAVTKPTARPPLPHPALQPAAGFVG
jgi:hypothetical protein